MQPEFYVALVIFLEMLIFQILCNMYGVVASFVSVAGWMSVVVLFSIPLHGLIHKKNMAPSNRIFLWALLVPPALLIAWWR